MTLNAMGGGDLGEPALSFSTSKETDSTALSMRLGLCLNDEPTMGPSALQKRHTPAPRALGGVPVSRTIDEYDFLRKSEEAHKT